MAEPLKRMKEDNVINISQVMPGHGKDFIMPETRVPRHVIKDLYLEGLALSAVVFDWASKPELSDYPFADPINQLISRIIELLSGPDYWSLLCECRASSEPLYLPAHSMNVCITSTFMGLQLGIPDDQLTDLAVVSFLHDMGMARIPNIWEKGTRLDETQKKQLHSHPIESLKVIHKTGCCSNPEIALAAAEHQERIDGSGYPNNKVSTDISAASHIISVTDSFDAMTHARAYRKPIHPFEAVRLLSRDAGTSLQTQAVRTFIQSMSIYPIGSGVKLNNGKIARVVACNGKTLTRPVVNIIDQKGASLTETNQFIDLSSDKLIFIRQPHDISPLDPLFKIG
ncbi:MAG TPA: HD domain-containing phosphohydrolase [bacterium]|nr:HD domain-containing phosphohydrolase [bacterium]